MTKILTDIEFTSVIDSLLGKTVVNTTSDREHVAEIERDIQTEKERGRALLSTLPFYVLLKLIIVTVIKFGVFWLNTFPVKNVREVVTPMKISFLKHCRVPFGTYCEVHDEPAITNTIKARTHEGIAMVPKGNFQGSHKFFASIKGRSSHADILPKWRCLKASSKGLTNWVKSPRKKFLVVIWPSAIGIGKDMNWTMTMTSSKKPDYQKHWDIAAEFPGVVLEQDQVSPVPAIDELIQDDNAIPAEAIANSFIPGVDTTEPRQRQSWADVVINRPTTPGVGSQLQSALKTEQAINVLADEKAPPGVLFAENIEDAHSDDDDAESEDDEGSS